MVEMKRASVVIVLALLVVFTGEANGQVNLGVFGGASLTDLAGDAPLGTKYESTTGFAAGILGEFMLTDDIWLSLQPMYVEKGSDLLVGFRPGGEPDTLGFSLEYVTLPILLKFVSRNRKTYFAGGIDLGFLAGATLGDDGGSADVEDALNDLDLSADFAFGLMLPIGRPALTLEARYTQSILNVAKQDPEAETGPLPTRFRSSGFQFFGGLVYPLGRSSVAESQAGSSRTSGGGDRTDDFRRPRLARHAFTPNTLVPDPFIKTFIRNTVAIGSAANIEIPVAVIDGDTIIGFEGDVMLAMLGFEYQGAVRDWLAARGKVAVLGRLGTNVGALLASGITASTGFEFGWLARLFQSDRTLLSADLKLSSNNFTFINVTDFVEDIIDGRSAELVRSTPSVRGGGGLRFAWGVSPLFGLTAAAETGYGESVERGSENQWYFELGTTLDFDLMAVSRVPLGIVLGYEHSTFPEGGDDISDDIDHGLLRVAYTGRSDFVVALDVAVERFNSKQLNQWVNFSSIAINLRYYF
jgi:hypothetical protein